MMSLLVVQCELSDILRRRVDRQLAELVNIQLAPLGILDGDRKNFRLQARAVASLARHARHEGADAIARKLALGFLVKPLHLRNEPFERPRRLGRFTVAARVHLNRLIARAVVERLLERLGQIRKRNVVVDREVFHERALQTPVIGLHRFGAATPRSDRAFRQRLFRIGHHQIGIANELRSQSVAGRTRAQMTVERKMFRRQFA